MYDSRYLEEQKAKYDAALSSMIVDSSGPALDVGCGSGMLFSQIAPLASMIVGVDISKELLLLAKARAKVHSHTSVVLGDADHLPFKDNVFESVFVFTVLQNMPKPVETLRELRRIGTGNAKFVISALKAAIPLDAFNESLEKAGMQVISLKNDETLRCHISTCLSRRE
jgi:ubiquinone/menaquinone biosynthesis C-methylase UbiE